MSSQVLRLQPELLLQLFLKCTTEGLNSLFIFDVAKGMSVLELHYKINSVKYKVLAF